MSSIHACPINRFYSWWNYMPFNKWLTGIVLFGLGVYFAIFGQKHFTYSSGFIIGGTAGFILHGIFQPVIPGISFICNNYNIKQIYNLQRLRRYRNTYRNISIFI